MAEKENKNQPKDLIEPVPEELEELDEEISEELESLEGSEDAEEPKIIPEEELRKLDRKTREEKERENALASWVPKTEMGRGVRAGTIKDIDKILKEGKRILEPQIVDKLLSIQTDLILIGQAKGKFGGGKRRAWRQTQKKTKEGNVLTFSSMAVVGDTQGHVGIGYGRAKETLPAREKAIRLAKLNIIKIQRGYEALEPGTAEPHTVPFKVSGKCGSVTVTLIPAPRGTGLAVADECKKILKLAGIEDVYGRTDGKTKTTFNLAKACVNALSKIEKFEQ